MIKTCLEAFGVDQNQIWAQKMNFLGSDLSGSHASCHIVHFAGSFWRPSRCPNWACDSSLERYWSLISKKSGIMQFEFHLPCQKSNLPTLVKMSRMRLPQGRVMLQPMFEGLNQLQIELMIAHWKYIFVQLSFYSSCKSFGQPCQEKS